MLLTYQELGKRLDISSEAARARVKRHGWPKSTDNHGRVVISIEEQELVAEAERSPPLVRPVTDTESPQSPPGDRSDDAFVKLKADRDRCRQAAHRWKAEADRRGLALATVEGKLEAIERVIAEQDKRATELTDALDHERRINTDLRQELAASRSAADELRRRRWWRWW